MYHFMATCAPEPLELSEKVQIPGHIRQYLKDFQLEALRFLHSHLANRDFCILNDESGLGKCVSTVVYLGAIAKNKTCLIVVQNDDELVAGWQFHFNILTNLTVGVLGSNTSILDSPPNITIAKWGTLRSTIDVNKCNYDYIIIDNRGQMLSNNFCMSMLLNNYEHKVNLLISSVDVTSDLKLLHNSLRLGGRLDHQYEQFKVFEAKYKLPDSKDVLNKIADLEQYFLKREMISDYCKDFRLRRYRHQFEDDMPLVDAERYKINLDLWHTISSSNSSQKSNDNVNNLNANSETATEELFNQALALNGEIAHYTEAQTNDTVIMPINEASEDALSMSPLLIDSESCDSDEAEIVDITNQRISLPQSKEPVPDIYEFVDLSTENCSEEYVSNVSRIKQHSANKSSASLTNLRSPARQISNIKTIIIKDTQEIDNTKNSTKSEVNRKKTKLKASKEVLEEKTNRKKEDHNEKQNEVLNTCLELGVTTGDINKNTILPKRQIRNKSTTKQDVVAESQTPQVKDKNTEAMPTTKRRTIKQPEKYLKETTNKKISTDKTELATPAKQKKLEQSQKSKETKATVKTVERTISKKSNEAEQHFDKPIKAKDQTSKPKNHVLKEKEIKTKQNMSETKETSRPLRQTRAVKVTVKKDKHIETFKEVTSKQSVVSATTKNNAEEADKVKENTSSKDSPKDDGVQQKVKPKLKNKSPETPIVRNTRSMQQRQTRSRDVVKSKYMKSPLLLECSKKPRKKKAISAQDRPKPAPKDMQDVESATLAAERTSQSQQNGSEKNATEENSKSSAKTTQNKSQKRQKTNLVSKDTMTNNTTDSAILPCSDNTEDMQCGQKIIADTHSDNGFLRPPTPIRNVIRNTESRNLLPTPSSFTDSEVVFVPSADAPNKNHSIVVLSSSTDDGSLSSQQSTQSRRTRALKQKKSLKRPALDTANSDQLPTTPTFGELLAKQRAQRKSPDLFSASTELGLTCTQRTADERHDGVDTFQGFKIFGSEVKQMQQQHAETPYGKKSNQMLGRSRSCLNILEKMFDTPRTEATDAPAYAQTQPTQQTKSSDTPTSRFKKAPDSKLVKRTTRGSQPVMPALPNAVSAAQSHEQNQQAEGNNTATSQVLRGTMEDEEIFEITHNDAFGSVMRINSNGEISPVQTTLARTQAPTQHNKITNYLIGTTQLTPTEATMDERTPSKRTPQTQLSGTAARRSPKGRATQSTKLTKWFQKNDTFNDLHANAAQHEIATRTHTRNTMAKRLKRRCLELSFRN